MKAVKYLAIAVLIAFLTATSIAPVSAQESQIFSPSQDNTLIESVTGDISNGQGEMFFVGRTNQPKESLRRGLLAFDLSDRLPSNAQITAASLTLTVMRSPQGDYPIELHRVLKDWGEGESYHRGGQGDRATEGDATWVHRFYDGSLWSNLGGDFCDRVSAVQRVGDGGSYRWESPEMLADVQRWLDSPEENFGWLLLGDETTARSVKGFASRETGDALALPQLTISYHL
ncbi:DNRLRE domain-containing protein [Spirulina sp. 06S082]|uniref:DNRLRE domain-containing protein n=1 Tax=Spirulina sp. 06S082 TaxID=3110248 RepID=UPI002B1F0F67|nr:DNRLRE domain-containing protein [Spirulina sp. 06S082]MEA5470910.1 DNRLRE domain-containing protein [Spirulina sp. 06S082]